MKKISILCLSGLLFLTACDNSGSSTIGTYEKDETLQSTQKNESASHEQQSIEKSENLSSDTLKHSPNPGKEASSGDVKASSKASADSNNSKP